ncbi:hypothetical protein FRB93_002143 [Tulasnella sp. JGI-2019a]|nr:hypothetical protein FRB93_002143 [Tulasnella sp. JGI-2019a]
MGHVPEDEQLTKEEILEYLEKNLLRTAEEIANDLATGSGEDRALSHYQIFHIVSSRLRAHTTPLEDRIIFEYYKKNPEKSLEDIVSALYNVSDLSRLSQYRIRNIVKYLIHFQTDLGDPNTLRLPGSKEINMALKTLRSYPQSNVVTKEQIVTAIQYYKENQGVAPDTIVPALSAKLALREHRSGEWSNTSVNIGAVWKIMYLPA